MDVGRGELVAGASPVDRSSTAGDGCGATLALVATSTPGVADLLARSA
jgi:hypothetical protein